MDPILKALPSVRIPILSKKSLKSSEKKVKGNFLQTFELQVSFKNIDRVKETGFKSSTLLNYPFKDKSFSICLLASEKDAIKARELGINVLLKNDLAAIKGDKKACKKLACQYDCFLASISMIREIPPILRKNLAMKDKFPSTIIKSEELAEKIEEEKRKVNIVLKVKPKASLNIGFACGKMNMNDNELAENAWKIIDEITKKTKKGWNNIAGIVVKSTMGKPVRIA